MHPMSTAKLSVLSAVLLGACGALSPLNTDTDGTSCDTSVATCPTASVDTSVVTTTATGSGTGTGLDCSDPANQAVCDADGDGYIAEAYAGDDCDDTNGAINPGAPEICDAGIGVDNDCDGQIDEDGDGDGSGVCDDCDDADGTRYPGAPETCDDGVDSDCDDNDCIFWEDDFETNFLGPHWVQGTIPWKAERSDGLAYCGNHVAFSGPVGDNQISSMTLTLDFSAGGRFIVWYKLSTDVGDGFRLLIDGEAAVQEWGIQDWTEFNRFLDAGQHTIEFRYVKDGSGSAGLDAVAIDAVYAEDATPVIPAPLQGF